MVGRMGDARVRDLTDEQNAKLRPLVQQLLDKVGNQTEVGRLIGMSQSAVSGFMKGRQGTSYAVALNVCALTSTNPGDVLGFDEAVQAVLGDADALRPFDLGRYRAHQHVHMPIGTFLLKLDRLPGLRQWIEANPTAFTVPQVVVAVGVYDEAKPASGSNGEPLGGWSTFIADAFAGRLTQRPSSGGQTEAESTEESQMTPSARRRLKKP